MWNASDSEIQVKHTYEKVTGHENNTCAICGWIWKRHVLLLQDNQESADSIAEDYSFTMIAKYDDRSTKQINILVDHPGIEPWQAICEC